MHGVGSKQNNLDFETSFFPIQIGFLVVVMGSESFSMIPSKKSKTASKTLKRKKEAYG